MWSRLTERIVAGHVRDHLVRMGNRRHVAPERVVHVLSLGTRHATVGFLTNSFSWSRSKSNHHLTFRTVPIHHGDACRFRRRSVGRTPSDYLALPGTNRKPSACGICVPYPDPLHGHKSARVTGSLVVMKELVEVRFGCPSSATIGAIITSFRRFHYWIFLWPAIPLDSCSP